MNDLISITLRSFLLFNSRIKLLPPRKGERFASAMTSMNLSNKVYRIYGKKMLKIYIKNFIKIHKKVT